MIGYAYATGSTEKDLACQWSIAHKWAQQNCIERIENHADRSSATSTKHPALDAVLSGLKKNQGVLIVQRLANLSSSPVRAVRLLVEIVTLGGRLVSVADELDTAGPEAEGIKRLAEALAHQNQLLGKTRIQKLEALRMEGRSGGTTPYGYKRTDDGNFSVADTNEMNLVGNIIRLRRSGRSYAQIGAELQDLGFRPRRGKRWHPKVVMSIYKRHEDIRAVSAQRVGPRRSSTYIDSFDLTVAAARRQLKVPDSAPREPRATEVESHS